MNDRIEKLIEQYNNDIVGEEDSRKYLTNVLLSDDDGNQKDDDNLSLLVEPFFENHDRIHDFVQELKVIWEQLQQQQETTSSKHDQPPTATKTSTHHVTTTEESSSDHGDDDDGSNDDGRLAMTGEKIKRKKPTKEEREQRRAERKAARLAKKKNKKEPKKTSKDDDEVDANNIFLDDDVSAWEECQKEGRTWGGRGYGGRGVRSEVNTAGNIHLPNLTLQFAGNELLQSTLLQLNGGHCYGLLGRIGVGKSTLLRRLASHKIPGTPSNLRILLVEQTPLVMQVQQENNSNDDNQEGSSTTVLDALLTSDTAKTGLLQEQEQLEMELDQIAATTAAADNDRFQQIVQRLEELALELDNDDDEQGAERRAVSILQGLSFTDAMMNGPVTHLSGGWRMRLALAQALFIPHVDLLLLDEPTNHLDLQALDWLGNFINQRRKQQEQNNKTGGAIVVISHDRTFLDMICTDMIVMEHQRLSYHPGNYSEYVRQMEERASFQSTKLESSAKQRQHLLTTIAKNSHSSDPKKQKQAKMMKEKKLDRIGNYRDDGKRYQQFSLAKMDMSTVRLAQKVQLEQDDPIIRMKFPTPIWSPNMSEGCSLLTMQDLYFKYNSNTTMQASTAAKHTSDSNWLLNNVTAELHRGSKVALVGRNGVGKSSLLKLLLLQRETTTSSEKGKSKGKLWHHPNLRMGYISQHSVEELEANYKDLTVLEYAQQHMKGATKVDSNVRQYLGSFGLGSTALAHRKIGSLSGGERMRLCFATVLGESSTPPQLLVCDEPTNHLDLETLDALGTALDAYQGAVLIVSHNQGFLSNFCNELWVLEKSGHLDVKRSTPDDTFDELFSEYRHDSLARGADKRRTQRQRKANMARKATKQRAGAKEGTGFIP